jgi:hypothetical protein
MGLFVPFVVQSSLVLHQTLHVLLLSFASLLLTLHLIDYHRKILLLVPIGPLGTATPPVLRSRIVQGGVQVEIAELGGLNFCPVIGVNAKRVPLCKNIPFQ